MTGEGPCGLCDRDPAAGYASISRGDVEVWYCHDESEDTCYEKASRAWGTRATNGLPPMSGREFFRQLDQVRDEA